MPRVHAQFRVVTDIDPVSLQPEDTLGSEPEEDEDVGRRIRRQRRIECIANQYLKLGRVPLIVSAGLRGPFNNGWKNPWLAAPIKANGNDARTRHRKASSPADPSRAVSKRTRMDRAEPAPSFPSPEVSRAPDIAQDSVLPPESFQDEDHNPPDAPMAQQEEPGATQFFSANTDPSVTFDNFESNPFWLKRPQLKPVASDNPNSANGNHDPSPTRARLGYRPVDRNGRLLLATPRQPMPPLQSDPGRTQTPEPEWMSAAFTSMITSSPANTAKIIRGTMSSGLSTRKKRTYSRFERGSKRGRHIPDMAAGDTSPLDHASKNDAPIERSLHNSNELGDYCASSPDAHNALQNAESAHAREDKFHTSEVQEFTTIRHHQTSPFTSTTKTRNPHELNQHTAESTTQSGPASSSHKKRKKLSKQGTPTLRHDHITSPTLASSTGFMYRKVREAKRANDTNNSEPQPVKGNPPGVAEKVPGEIAEHEAGSAGLADQRIERPDVYDVPDSPQKQKQRKPRRTSDFSTQAALMKAQMEFQDGSIPATVAKDARKPWQPSTAHKDAIIPSPAFTPFHKFNAALSEGNTSEQALQDIPISTQDLFATISPFANSTVKKSTKAPASNLRFSVFANREQDSPSHGSSRDMAGSPSSSQRRPLREKNSRVSFLGSQSEKGSQGEKVTQESMTPPGRKGSMVQSLGLPQIDFGTSNSDLDFTDRFLIHVNELT